MRTPATSLLRGALRASRTTTMVPRAAASTHAISNPTLAKIEKRWEGMPQTEQAELWMALRDRMKENWTELTVQEKKAGTLYQCVGFQCGIAESGDTILSYIAYPQVLEIEDCSQ